MTTIKWSVRSVAEPPSAKLFGSVPRTRVLTTVAALGETYPRELARLVDAPLVTVQRIVDDLERQGILATRLRGQQRLVTLNPRYLLAKEIKALLEAMVERIPEYRAILAKAVRRRPRRAGKPL